MIQAMTTSQKMTSPMLKKISILDKGSEKRYPVQVRGACAPRPLLCQAFDQIDQRLDEVQDCGDKDDGLEGFVLIAAFLFPGYFVHLLCCSVIIIYHDKIKVNDYFVVL